LQEIVNCFPQSPLSFLVFAKCFANSKNAKTLKTKGFTIESRNKFGKVVFRVSILRYEKGYKKFRVQATPKGEDKRIDKECDSEWECHELVQKWEREKPNPYKDSE